jgi:hypothetical protein
MLHLQNGHKHSMHTTSKAFKDSCGWSVCNHRSKNTVNIVSVSKRMRWFTKENLFNVEEGMSDRQNHMDIDMALYQYKDCPGKKT